MILIRSISLPLSSMPLNCKASLYLKFVSLEIVLVMSLLSTYEVKKCNFPNAFLSFVGNIKKIQLRNKTCTKVLCLFKHNRTLL